LHPSITLCCSTIEITPISSLFPYTTLFRSATVHNDEQTPHMHLGVVPMRDGKLQGKNVFNRQELLWLQDKFPEHMKKQGFELKRGERGSDRKHIETAKFKKQTL